MFPDPLEAGAKLLRGQKRPFAAGVAAVEVCGCGVLQTGEEFGIVTVRDGGTGNELWDEKMKE